MNRKKFLTTLSGLSILSSKAFSKSGRMEIDFMRHATFTLRVGEITFLVDPMLSAKDEMDPVGNSPKTARIPMVDLPFSESALKEKLQNVNAVIVTHLHRDHWDAKARTLLDKKIPLICQPSDVEKLTEQGFTRFVAVDTETEFKGLKIYRTGGQHGTGEIGIKMGQVSGFVIEYQKKKIYIAGDTIWCTEVEQAISTHKPDFVVLNAGAAQFNEGDPITMTSRDVIRTMKAIPSATIIAVHMETVNHCLLTRKELKKELEETNLLKKSVIPLDGERIHLV
jgi:L-ascorbate metabolism protein UlaG (beta-lactamase superfamily)